MRRRLASSALALAAVVTASPAVAMRGGAVVEVAPGEAPLRVEPSVAYRAAPPARAAAFANLVADTGDARWRALWDEDTGAPLRVYGGFARAPGAVASPAIAEAHARAFLARHLDLIAPSAAPGDFVLVANELHAGLRTVAFAQRVRVAGVGLVPVVGAVVSLGYKNDRLFVFGSEAARATAFAAPSITEAAAAKVARAWILADHGVATTRGAPELVADHLVRHRREELRLVYRVEVVATSPRGAFEVFVDARTGRAIARASLLRFAAEEVLIDAPVRNPDAARMNYPAVFESVVVGAMPVSTDANGFVTWNDPTATMLTTAPAGEFVDVETQAGSAVSGLFPLADGSQALWSRATDELADAQLSAYVHMNRVRQHALGIASDMAFLSSVIVGKPNEPDPAGCNAFWDGFDLNFYVQNAECNNTARVSDVVYHEFGHGFHQNAVIAGVGMLDPALGEGTADFMAVSTTGDPNVAPGFYRGEPTTPLRKVDTDRRWPEDISNDPHETGLIWASAMWDLRTYLREELGDDAGAALADELYYGGIQRASNIPTTFVEVLAADDDDGDLGNGTPHLCEIERAFSRHGLADGLDATGLTIAHAPLDIVHGDAGYSIAVDVVRAHPECKHGIDFDSVVASVTVDGQPSKDVDLRAVGDRYEGVLPGLPNGSVFGYHVTAKAGRATIARPDNPADPEYDVFVGETKALYCTGFEAGADGFRFDDGARGRGMFEVGEPKGKGGDPDQAYAGKNVIGTTLGGDGLYLANRKAFAHAPVVELHGARDVHLQMRRWLTVEDGFYDHATISANGTLLWQNIGTNESDGTLDLIDKEWRFVDVDLSSVATDTVEVTIGLDADPLDEFGGWNVDQFCIVSVEDAAIATTSSSSGGGTEAASEAMGCGCEVAGENGSSRGVTWPAFALALIALATRRRDV